MKLSYLSGYFLKTSVGFGRFFNEKSDAGCRPKARLDAA
jgi:hypothetical protein